LFAGVHFDVNCVKLHSMCLQITQEGNHLCNEVRKKVTAYILQQLDFSWPFNKQVCIEKIR